MTELNTPLKKFKLSRPDLLEVSLATVQTLSSPTIYIFIPLLDKKSWVQDYQWLPISCLMFLKQPLTHTCYISLFNFSYLFTMCPILSFFLIKTPFHLYATCRSFSYFSYQVQVPVNSRQADATYLLLIIYWPSGLRNNNHTSGPSMWGHLLFPL